MDNPNSKNDETRWVEERMARLSPPPGWKPNTDQAFERVLQRATPATMSRGARLAMAGATLAIIGVVLSQLPWKVLWSPSPDEPAAAATEHQPEKREETASLPKTIQAATPPAVQPPIPEETAVLPTPPVQPAPVAAQPESRTQPERPKKLPRFIAAETSVMQESQTASRQQGQTDSVTQPIVTYKVQPQYTDEARQAKIQGIVVLMVTIREDGNARVDKVVQSLGYGLDEASIAAVEMWKFIPGKKNEQAVAVQTTLTINFALK